MAQPIVVVDAFTRRPFAGNPAAVCVLERAATDAWMKALARELNLSETAFLLREGDRWRIRWITPTVEIDLCGHATLASAHVLWESGRLALDAQARFVSRGGPLGARREGEHIVLDFPQKLVEPCASPEGLEAALGARLCWVGCNDLDFLVELADEATVRGLAPDFRALARLGARGVIVTAKGSGGYDIVSRFFAPGSGINEDPVTGSAHCALGPYWAEKLGKRELEAFQASARGGEIRVTLAGDRVALAGHAVTVWRGELGDAVLGG